MSLAIPCALVIVLAAQVATSRGGATRFGAALGADYPAFHAAGRLLLEHPARRLYDLDLQYRLEDEARPGAPPRGSLCFPNPPFAALPFVPLALLSYTASYMAWMATSVLVVILGLRLLRWSCPTLAVPTWRAAAGLVFASSPLLLEAIAGGQIAALAFGVSAVALALACRGRVGLAGLVLSLLAYKPTLLLLLVPCLALGRRWRTLAGMAVGGTSLLLVSLAVAGPEGCRGWVELMRSYGRLSSGAASAFRLTKFVDLPSCLHLALGDAPWVGRLALGLSIVPLLALGSFWMRRRITDEPALWAATLTWTLVLNLHVAIYDIAVALPGVLVTLEAMARRSCGSLSLSRLDRCVLTLAWCTPWFSQIVAERTGWNLLTPVLALLAAWQLVRAELAAR